MVFSNLLFLYAFLPLSLLVYFFCPNRKAQNVSLLVFSLIFYAWGEPKYVLLLMFMALVSWFCALRVDRAEDRKKARLWVIAAAVVDIGLIGFFKYSGFICSVFGEVPKFIRKVALPIGISFYTFQLLTYVIDIYRGEAEAQESYWNVLLYAALFHQCIAGPIVRYKTVAQELFEHREPELVSGIRRFALGLGKKALLANPCGAIADSLMLTAAAASDPAALAENLRLISSVTVLEGWMGLLAYALQIYLDFSAYSDMAIGMGRMLGLHYLENFNYPYISRSVGEFWRRWHISLGTFFRDYVYIPLGGNRCSKPRMIFNLFVVWALAGLWHGASWNYVLWGLYFFVFLMLERLFLGKWLDKLHILPHIYALAVCLFGWLIFRYTDLRCAEAWLRSMFAMNGNALTSFVAETTLENNIFLLAAAILCSTPALRRIYESISRAVQGRALAGVWEVTVSCVVPVALLLLSTCALVGDSYNPFIYFQF